MKKITFLASMLLAVALQAQYYYLPPQPGNPGTQNSEDTEYPVGGGIGAGWATILGPSLSAPAFSTAQNIPFAFSFNGSAVTQYKVSSSGVLTFDVSATTAPSYTHGTLPDASIPNNSVCIWGITAVGTNDYVVSKTFGTAPNRQHWVHFTSCTKLNQSSSWTYWSIVLEETTNKIYMVDQRNANLTGGFTLGIQINSTTAYSVVGSPSVAHLSGNSAARDDNFHYTWVQGVQPAYDMAGVKVLNNDVIALTSAPFTLSAQFVNFGTATINSATINYRVNGGAAVSVAAPSFTAASYATVTINHPTTWTPAAGTYNVEMWLTNINGNPDANTANDKATKSIVVVPNLTTRYPMYENFSSSTCAPCTPANINIHGIFANHPGEHVALKYQMSWPGTGDPYYTLEGGARRTYYGINAVPYTMIDGGWNGNGNSLTEAIYNEYKAVPAFVEMSAQYSVSGQTICVDVEIDPLANINVSDLVLHIAVKERLTTANVKTNGETEFKDVMKKLVPNENGTTIPALVAGQKVTRKLCYTFQGSYILPANATVPVNHATNHTVEQFSDLGAAVWLQSVGTKTVYQAAEAVQVLGVDDFNAETHNLQVFPNPASDVAYLSVDMDRDAKAAINIVNMLGQMVYSTTADLESGTSRVELPIRNFAAGVYFVNVEINGVTQTVKLSVQ